MQDLYDVFLQLIFLFQKQLSAKHPNSLTHDYHFFRFTTFRNTILRTFTRCLSLKNVEWF